MARITLSQIMDSDAVDGHLDELKAAFAQGGRIVIDCEGVGQIGTIGLQLLACAVRTAQQRDVEIHLTLSQFVETTAKLAGLDDLLCTRQPSLSIVK